MKICSPQLGMDPNSILGGEVHDHYILNNLAKKGNVIYVYLPKDRSYQKHQNIFVERAPFKHIPAIFFNFLIIPYLFRTYNKEKFDVLRVHSPYFIGLGALIFKLFHNKVPIIVTYHLPETGFIFNLLNKFTIRKYNLIFVVSNFLKQWIVDNYHVDPGKIKVIYNGVPKSLKPSPKKLNLIKKYNLNNKIIILFMGLLISRKNPLLALEVFNKIRQTNKDISLIICGSGPQKTKIQSYIKLHTLKDVYLLNPVYGKAKNDIINLCDIFMLPSRNEGFGIVIAEAMKCKKAVIVSNSTSLPEIVENNKDGVVVATDNIVDWVSELLFLINNKNERIRLGKNAYFKSLRLFDWQKNAEEYDSNLHTIHEVYL